MRSWSIRNTDPPADAERTIIWITMRSRSEVRRALFASLNEKHGRVKVWLAIATLPLWIVPLFLLRGLCHVLVFAGAFAEWMLERL